MAEIGSAFLSILPSARGFGSKLEKDVSGDVNGVGKRVGSSFGKAFAAGGALIAAAGIGSFLKDSIGEAREAQKVGAATTAIIKATGGAANLTAKQVGNLSGALSAKIGVDDEIIQSGANILLTFKAVRDEVGKGNDVFTRATAAGADLAAAGFGSIESNAKTLGKALNDPLKGITALTRSGVTFTEQQKEQIKTLVESGNTLKAQKIILGEVEKQVGGVAAATATSGEKAAVAFGNLKEQIGTALLPVVDKVAGVIADKVVPAVSKFIRQLQNGRGVGGAFASAIKTGIDVLIGVFNTLRPVVDAAFGFIRDNPTLLKNFAIGLGIVAIGFGAVAAATTLFSIALNSTGIPLLIIGLAALAGGLYYAYQNSAQFRAIIDQIGASLLAFGQAVIANVVPVLRSLANTFVTVIVPAVTQFANYLLTNLAPVFLSIVNIVTTQVIPIISSLAQFFVGTLIPAVVQIAQAVGAKLRPIFEQLVATFQTKVLPALQLLLAKFREYQPAIQTFIGAVVKIIGKLLEFAAAVLGKVLPPIIRFAGFIIGNVVPAVVAYISIVAKIIGKLIELGSAITDRVKDAAKFVKGLKEKFDEAVAYVKGIPEKVKSAIGDLGSLLSNAGSELVQGLIDGIVSKIKPLADKVGELGSLIKGAFPGSPVKWGPLKSWNDGKGGVSAAGDRLIGGLIDGIDGKIKPLEGKVREAAQAILDGLESKRDQIKSTLDGLKSDFASLSDGIASTFKGNLFEATTSFDFIKNLSTTSQSLTKLKAAFKKLLGYGLSPQFLSQLFQSGNAGLILDLAAGPKDVALIGQDLFNEVGALGDSLGNKVARADIGPKIDQTNKRLERIESAIKDQARQIAKELNNVAADSRRQGAAA